MPQLESLCASVLQHVRSSVSAECYNTWFKDLSIQSAEGSSVCFCAPNRYVKHWLESHYKKELLRSVSALLPEAKTVELSVVNGTRAPDSSALLSKVLDQAMPSTLRNNNKPAFANGRQREESSVLRLPPLSAALRLESFLVGRSNRVAHSAAQSISESPASVYNPLFVHGAHGLGKTHLLQGIAHLLRERSPAVNAICISCEEFTNAYVSAVQNKNLDAFRSHFRTCDALLMDDVQFLGGREKTQEEFLHTFDALRQSHKQVVLCADTAPREIKRLDQKLITRFQSGLSAQLEAPETQLRVELLNKKAKDRGCHLSVEVTAVLAAHIERNVRELEGVICKLMALAAAEAQTPDRELAIRTLRELGYLNSGPLTLQDVLAAVVHHSRISADEIRSDKRHAPLVRARHLGIYLSKILTPFSAAEIGRFYGHRDHATVVHAARKLSDQIKRDENLRKEVHMLRQILGKGPTE